MFNWLSSLFNRRTTTTGRESLPALTEAVAVHNAVHHFPMAHTPPAQLRAYETSSWVYLAVNRIAEAAALVPLNVYRMAGDRREEVVRHPLERLLDAPNAVTSRFELFEQTIGALELTGNAYWLLVGDARGVPVEIWPLRPDRVAVVPDPVEYVRGYVYEIDGQRIPLDAGEVVHFKRWHPSNDYYGLSALEAARVAVESDQAMADWNRRTFTQDHAVPAGIVNVKEFIADADFERLKREWRTSYGGGQRKTAFLRGGSVEWQNIGLSHTDLDFLEGRKAHRDEILNLFGVPVALVSENATEANAKVAERLFIERTLYPKLVRVAQKITQELLPFWGGDLIAEFSDIRPTDVQARLQEIRAASAVLSVNEIRERFYHLPPVTWGALPPQHKTLKPPSESSQDKALLPVKAVQAATIDEQLAELEQWERFALRRVGRKGGRSFEPSALPDVVAFEVAARLMGADSADAIKAIFRQMRGVLMTNSAL